MTEAPTEVPPEVQETGGDHAELLAPNVPWETWLYVRSLYAALSDEECASAWVPIGHIGPILLLGHFSSESEMLFPIPAYLVQRFEISSVRYEEMLLWVQRERREIDTEPWKPPFSEVPMERPKTVTLEVVESLARLIPDTSKESAVLQEALSKIRALSNPPEATIREALPEMWSTAMEAITAAEKVHSLASIPVSGEFANKFKESYCTRNEFAPIHLEGKRAKIASWSKSRYSRERLGSIMSDFVGEGKVEVYLVPKSEGIGFLKRCFGGLAPVGDGSVHQSAAQNVQNQRGEVQLDIRPDRVANFDPKAVGADEKRLFEWCLYRASETKASDLHIQIEEGIGLVRLRVDGLLHTILSITAAKLTAVVSQALFISGMTANQRAPGDAKMRIRVGETPYDLRLSKLPVSDGERPALCVRFLPGNTRPKSLRELDLPAYLLSDWEWVTSREYGLVLVSGPTGSGKTTTLAAALTAVNDENTNVLTVEDPVEYRLPRAVQVAVTRETTFAAALRAFLRHDPDVILVGELRDRETAEVAVEAAKTGHLVFSTIHANHALAIPSRIGSMGIRPHEVSNAVIAIQAQRLLPRLCRHCSQKVKPSDRIRKAFEKAGMQVPERVASMNPAGCSHCRSGVQGRVLVMELLKLNDRLREAIATTEGVVELEKIARASGFRTMFIHGLHRLAAHEIDFRHLDALPQPD